MLSILSRSLESQKDLHDFPKSGHIFVEISLCASANLQDALFNNLLRVKRHSQ